LRCCPDLVDLVSLLILAGVLSAQAFLPSGWGSCPGASITPSSVTTRAR
jgi:hypothetical protein